jgi:hypothetical protein
MYLRSQPLAHEVCALPVMVLPAGTGARAVVSELNQALQLELPDSR